ncbi:probetacellulin [Triplophysa rosa]|uniref:Betacellulin n=1 Tax=Triplophysa rosa TaxID=992332 RepID=A0A9W7WEH6_TRIRA|nr:probetacellulin [Triplophysa rosa]KAI7796230.1 putative betacellulin [Triplophysa rosa]
MCSVDTGNEFNHLTRHSELQMDVTYRFILGIITAVALCKYSQAEWNTTQVTANSTVSCHHHDNSSNCTDSQDDHQWSGHFSECPKEFRHFCINGDCRFVKEQNTPSCRCEYGYIGTRCEYHDISQHVGEREKIVIACVVAVLVFLILFIIFICICSHKRYNPCRKKRRKNESVDEAEKLSSLNSNESAPVDTSDTNAV